MSENEDLDSSSASIPSIKADIILHVPSKLAEAMTLPFGLNSTERILDLCCLFYFSSTPPVVLFVIVSEIKSLGARANNKLSALLVPLQVEDR